MVKIWAPERLLGGVLGPLGPFWGPKWPQEASKRALRASWGGSQALQRPKKSCQVTPLIVLELQADPVSAIRGPPKGFKRAPKGTQEGPHQALEWQKPKKQKTL